MHYVVNLHNLKLTYIIWAKIVAFYGKNTANLLKTNVFQNVSFAETLCFYRRNKVFQWEKQSVSLIGTMWKQYQRAGAVIGETGALTSVYVGRM